MHPSLSSQVSGSSARGGFAGVRSLRRAGLSAALVMALLPSVSFGQGVPGAVPAGGALPPPPGPAGPNTTPPQITGYADPENPEVIRPGLPTSNQKPPPIPGNIRVTPNFNDADIYSLLVYFANMMDRSFIISDPAMLKGKKVTIIANQEVSGFVAWEAFVSALEVSGFTLAQAGDNFYRVVAINEAATRPIDVIVGDEISASAQMVTQIIPLANVSANEITQVIQSLKSPEAQIIAYAPTNTLILTENGYNLRKLYRIITELDVAAPKARMEIIPIVYATADDIKSLIEELYGTKDQTAAPADSRNRTTSPRRPRRDEAPAAPAAGESVTAGAEARFIQKVLSDERTNSIIVLANEEGIQAVMDLVKKLDVDVDLSSRSQIHVVHLEHAKAEDVSSVLQELSQAGGSSKRGGNEQTNQRAQAERAREQRGAQPAASAATGDSDATGALAAFDSGMRIAADENTNSLVIIASNEDFEVVNRVIKELDRLRKQVYLDCVILELTGDSSQSMGIAAHQPIQASEGSLGYLSSQTGASSVSVPFSASLTAVSLATGFTAGILGKAIDVALPTGQTISVPAFGIALNALASSSGVDIVSNPALMALDNEKAKIIVGQKIPFPTSSGLSFGAGINGVGQPLVSYQREDVAVTMEITPRINSENMVTLEIDVEAQEIDGASGSSSLNIPNNAGPTTSKRQVQTVTMVRDNQTVIIGGLVKTTQAQTESKIPVLGDLPLIGALFRSRQTSTRKTNLVVFLTPHIIDDPEDVLEILRVKEAQRQEFLRRFYGKTQAERLAGIYDLLQYSLNRIDQPSLYRGPSSVGEIRLDDRPISAETRAVIRDELDATRSLAPGDGAGVMPRSSATIDLAVPAESSSVPAAGAPAPASAPAPAPAEPAPVVPRVAPSGEGN